nr:formin-like protein 3 [Ipomoea trifida]
MRRIIRWDWKSKVEINGRVIDSDVKLLGIGGFCNAQEMDDNMVEQMWIGFPRKSLRDKKLWHKVLPPTSSASSPRAEAMLPIFTPPPPASSPLLSFEFPSLSPNEKRLLKSVLPLPIGHSPPISPHFIPPMPKSRPQKPKLPPPPMPRIHPHPMPKSQNPPMPRSHPPPIPKSPPQIPRSNPPPMPKSPPKKTKLPPPPMPRIHPHPMPKSQNPPMPKSPPQMPRSHPSMPRSHPPPMPKSPPKKPKLHPPPMPRIHPHPMPKSQNHPMPKSPPQMPRSHPSMPRSHSPPMSRSHHPPMPRSPSPLRPRSHPPPMPRSHHPPIPRRHRPPMPRSHLRPRSHPPQMPRSHPLSSPLKSVLPLPIVHPPPIRPPIIPPMPEGAKQMPQSNENPPGNVKELNTSSTLDSPLVKPDMIDSHTSTSSAIETKTPELTEAKCASSLLPPPPRLSAQGPVQPPKCVQAPAPPKGGQPPAPPKSGQPPAPPKGGQPPAPPKGGRAPAPPKPLAPNIKGRSSGAGSESGDSGKAKLKPFFWDKVNASPNRTMVWHELKSGSFEVNEEKMESLFGYRMVDKNHNERKKKDVSPFDSTPHFIQIIEARKAQNLAILLKALNLTTEEVCDALKEGNELPSEFVQTLLKMAPTEDEELKLRLFTGNLSQLAPADRFMKVLVGIPFAFKRMESLLFMTIFQEEISSVKQSFATLEVASKELSNSRLFLKLLEAVLKTGNRMNVGTYRGGAEAFKLDTLLKLSDVKGTDGKTSLLHFVVQEISRSEGLKSARRLKQNMSLSSVRTEDCVDESSRKESAEYYQSLGLQVLSKLGDELENVKKAAIIDHDNLAQSVAKLKHSLSKARDFLETDMKSVEGETEFKETLENFLKHAGEEITRQVEEEKRIMEMVKNTGDYFHGKTGKDEGTRLFVIVRDFLVALDKVCKEVEKLIKPANTTPGKGESQSAQMRDIPQQLFPAFKPQLAGNGFSSDDESSSP